VELPDKLSMLQGIEVEEIIALHDRKWISRIVCFQEWNKQTQTGRAFSG
jgi:hypothetical protein